MPANYVLLQRIELNASAASVTFSNIPQSGYTDLKLVISARTDRAASIDDCRVRPNNSTASQTMRRLQGSGSGTSSYTDTQVQFITPAASATTSTFSNTEVTIPNYLSSNFKSFSIDGVTENNATAAYAHLDAGLFSSTSTISSIVIDTYVGSNFVANSTFSLYGLAAVGTTPAIAPKAVGGSIYTDGTYWYHAFRTTDSFVPQVTLSADILVVAGGGGGGSTRSGYGGSGGAGAGGVLGFNSQSLAATSYTVTIGSGGAGGPSGGGDGSNGSNSTFGALTASVGGGAGGGATNVYSGPGANGGSGGGGESAVTSGNGLGTSGQGFNGGAGSGASAYVGGGGGGAGANGGSGTSGGAGAGGAGVNTYTNATWLGTALSVTGLGVSGYIAGGGGGGGYSPAAGGTASAGGGAGATNGGANASSGTINTGGGGGGATGTGTLIGGSGGSGIVIVRYAV